MVKYACIGRIAPGESKDQRWGRCHGVKGDATDAYFAVFADVFTLYSALTFFTCSSRYQDPCLLGICSREKSKNCQNSPVVEKSDETGVSVCILWGEKEEVGGRGSGVADLPSSGAWGPVPSSVNHLEADAGPLGRWMGETLRCSYHPKLHWEAAEQSSPRDPGPRDTSNNEEPQPTQISPSDPQTLLRCPEGDKEAPAVTESFSPPAQGQKGLSDDVNLIDRQETTLTL